MSKKAAKRDSKASAKKPAPHELVLTFRERQLVRGSLMATIQRYDKAAGQTARPGLRNELLLMAGLADRVLSLFNERLPRMEEWLTRLPHYETIE